MIKVNGLGLDGAVVLTAADHKCWEVIQSFTARMRSFLPPKHYPA